MKLPLSILLGILCATVFAGCYESHTRAMDRPSEPVMVSISCEPMPDHAVFTAGEEVQAMVCNVTPNREIEMSGTAIWFSGMEGTPSIVMGSAGTPYFTRIRTFVRETDTPFTGPLEMNSPTFSAPPGSRTTSLLGDRHTVRLHASRTVSIVLAFTTADHEDATGELLSTGASSTHQLVWGDWVGHLFGPSRFHLVEDGVVTRELTESEVSDTVGRSDGMRHLSFSVVR